MGNKAEAEAARDSAKLKSHEADLEEEDDDANVGDGESESGSEDGVEVDGGGAGGGGGGEASGNSVAVPKPTSASKARKKAEKVKAEIEKRGIIYMSRVPPHMKPAKVKQLLNQFGEVTRLYLAPEDPSMRRTRKKKGGNAGKEFTEGWIEFNDKRIAKRVALMLNGQQMGGKRRSAFHYDLWCLKYLPKFKWHHLTEDIAYQNAIREQKMAFEISTAKRERDFYLKQVGQGKAIAAMQERKRKRGEIDMETEGDKGAERARRDFYQRQAKPDPVEDAGTVLSDKTLRLISGKSAKEGSMQKSKNNKNKKSNA